MINIITSFFKTCYSFLTKKGGAKMIAYRWWEKTILTLKGNNLEYSLEIGSNGEFYKGKVKEFIEFLKKGDVDLIVKKYIVEEYPLEGKNEITMQEKVFTSITLTSFWEIINNSIRLPIRARDILREIIKKRGNKGY
jgi:hypothetical protein